MDVHLHALCWKGAQVPRHPDRFDIYQTIFDDGSFDIVLSRRV